jgi:hypothetical protein
MGHLRAPELMGRVKSLRRNGHVASAIRKIREVAILREIRVRGDLGRALLGVDAVTLRRVLKG